MILLSLLASAWGATAKFCFEISTDYTDIGGDYWPSNLPRPARGVFYAVRQGGVVIQTGNLDASGCGTATVNGSQGWQARILSEADYENVEFRSWQGSCHPTNAPEASPWFANVAGDLSMEEVVGPSDRWGNLAIALWAVHRNDHGIGDPALGVVGTNRACCVAGPTYQSDGTCSTGVSNYVPVQGPVYLYANPDNGAFADWIWDCADPAYPTRNTQLQALPGFRALSITQATKIRTLITHEFGHLVTSLRMGWSDTWTLNASLDGCMGDYAGAINNPFPSDSPGAVGGRGEFTKEYIAAAIREGYADYYAMWLWNNRNHPDCVLDMWTMHDLDLDCDIDNYFGLSHAMNGQIDCAQDWEVLQADPLDPTIQYSDGKNWLKDLQVAADSRSATSQYVCSPPPTGSTLQCVNDPFTSQSRATIIDLAKFFWKLNQVGNGGSGVPPEVVTDLYIDTCPREWAHADQAAFWDPAHPRARLNLSATQNGISTEVATQDDYFLP